MKNSSGVMTRIFKTPAQAAIRLPPELILPQSLTCRLLPGCHCCSLWPRSPVSTIIANLKKIKDALTFLTLRLCRLKIEEFLRRSDQNLQNPFTGSHPSSSRAHHPTQSHMLARPRLPLLQSVAKESSFHKYSQLKIVRMC